jgi:hypothetical protein
MGTQRPQEKADITSEIKTCTEKDESRHNR